MQAVLDEVYDTVTPFIIQMANQARGFTQVTAIRIRAGGRGNLFAVESSGTASPGHEAHSLLARLADAIPPRFDQAGRDSI